MSIDLAHPPPNAGPETALRISQLAPRFLKRSTKAAPFPLSLLSPDETTETWTSYETLFMECLRTGDDQSAKQILDKLLLRFGDKNERVMALQGMWEEAMAQSDKDLDEVLRLYGEILTRDGANIPVQKRRICVLKSMGKTSDAIAKLVELLTVSPTDAEAWAELSDLYLTQDMADQAIFCLEEVLIIQPNAWSIHAKLGEIIYSSADAATTSNAVELSRIYAESMRRYLRSIELCENYLRGYYGLTLTTEKLLPLVPEASRASTKDDTFSDLALPTEGTVQALNEMAVAKLGEIVRRGSARERGWDGYDEAELKAARELLNKASKDVSR